MTSVDVRLDSDTEEDEREGIPPPTGPPPRSRFSETGTATGGSSIGSSSSGDEEDDSSQMNAVKARKASNTTSKGPANTSTPVTAQRRELAEACRNVYAEMKRQTSTNSPAASRSSSAPPRQLPLQHHRPVEIERHQPSSSLRPNRPLVRAATHDPLDTSSASLPVQRRAGSNAAPSTTLPSFTNLPLGRPGSKLKPVQKPATNENGNANNADINTDDDNELNGESFADNTDDTSHLLSQVGDHQSESELPRAPSPLRGRPELDETDGHDTPSPWTWSNNAPSITSLLHPRHMQEHVKKAMVKRLPAYKWTAVQVRAWLDALGLGAYGVVFMENGVDGATLLRLTEDQVREGLHVRDERHLRSFELGLLDVVERRVNNVSAWEWSIEKVVAWLEMRGLSCLQSKFRRAAMHGGVLFRSTEEEFKDLGVGRTSPLVLMSLLAAIERARIVGPKPASDVAVPDWGPKRVSSWLDSLHLSHLEPVFRAHCVNGSLLLKLDAGMMHEHLQVTEIQSLVLERAVSKLRRGHAWNNSRPVKSWRALLRFAKTKAPLVLSSVRRASSLSSLGSVTSAGAKSGFARAGSGAGRRGSASSVTSLARSAPVSTPVRPPRPAGIGSPASPSTSMGGGRADGSDVPLARPAQQYSAASSSKRRRSSAGTQRERSTLERVGGPDLNQWYVQQQQHHQGHHQGQRGEDESALADVSMQSV